MSPAYVKLAQTIARHLGVRAPIHVQPMSNARAQRIASAVGKADALGEYTGTFQGAHVVFVRLIRDGRKRTPQAVIHSLAHEITHAAQCERVGGQHAFFQAYRAQGAYDENTFEVEARQRADEITRLCAAELEKNGC